MALIQAKWDEYLGGLDVGDPKDQFVSASCKWRKIVDFMNISGHLLLLRNNVDCKDKWGGVYRDFEHILYYMISIGNNIRYCDLTS
jgi:hypothetical protein